VQFCLTFAFNDSSAFVILRVLCFCVQTFYFFRVLWCYEVLLLRLSENC